MALNFVQQGPFPPSHYPLCVIIVRYILITTFIQPVSIESMPKPEPSRYYPIISILWTQDLHSFLNVSSQFYPKALPNYFICSWTFHNPNNVVHIVICTLSHRSTAQLCKVLFCNWTVHSFYYTKAISSRPSSLSRFTISSKKPLQSTAFFFTLVSNTPDKSVLHIFSQTKLNCSKILFHKIIVRPFFLSTVLIL